jgi:hypothetical protein
VVDLVDVRGEVRIYVQRGLDAAERSFLCSLVAGDPDWDLLGVPHLSQLPSVQWKLRNLERLQSENPAKFAAQQVQLKERFAAVAPPSE